MKLYLVFGDQLNHKLSSLKDAEVGADLIWMCKLRSESAHVLILEAVLSKYHRPDGNPDIRGDFEKGRGWYHGPVVTTYADI